MLRVGILGYAGRMGQLIEAEIAGDARCVLVGGLVRTTKPELNRREGLLLTSRADEIITISDVVIDFTSAEVTTEHAHMAAAHGKAFVSGVTGLTPLGQNVLAECAKKIPLLHAANTSLSLTAMENLTFIAASLLGSHDYDVTIVDEHHRMKKDAPSGTAKVLGAAVHAGSRGQKVPSYAAVRAGSIVGEHEVIFAGNGEVIRLHHSVTDRRIFARGAIDAALWLFGKPKGLYHMADVLGLKKSI